MTDLRNLYGYYINLDERGMFYADVRNAWDETVFEINSERDDLVEDSFMRDRYDTEGLGRYLTRLGILPPDAELMPRRDFEARLDALDEPCLASDGCTP